MLGDQVHRGSHEVDDKGWTTAPEVRIGVIQKTNRSRGARKISPLEWAKARLTLAEHKPKFSQRWPDSARLGPRTLSNLVEVGPKSAEMGPDLVRAVPCAFQSWPSSGQRRSDSVYVWPSLAESEAFGPTSPEIGNNLADSKPTLVALVRDLVRRPRVAQNGAEWRAWMRRSRT